MATYKSSSTALVKNETTVTVSIKIINDDSKELDSVRTLFREYQEFLDVSLCFQSFEDELAALPGKYSASKDGCLYLANSSDQIAGCVAFYRMNESTCELKRLFVRPQFHGRGLGRLLMERACEDAKRAGYETMVLDSLARLTAACKLYASLGFSEVAPYNENPHADVLYFSKQL